jgi:hypothetical protein
MKLRITGSIFALLMLLMLVSSASAQVQRTFVSGLGSDSNPCTRIAPCRTFGQALMGTSAGGEVVVLDSAGYGTFTITRAVSITAPPGVYAGISVFGLSDGIDINAGASDTVILRGLTINSQGSTGSGIVFTAGGTLHIENCVVNGFSGSTTSSGVSFNGAGNLEVKDSIIRGNLIGIFVHPLSGTAVAAIDQVRLETNSEPGLAVREGSRVTVRNSIASRNLDGFAAISATSADAELNIENCVASNNEGGILAESFGTGAVTVRVSNSTVTGNTSFGLENSTGSPAVILSRGNNTVEGNTTNTVGTIGSYTAK